MSLFHSSLCPRTTSRLKRAHDTLTDANSVNYSSAYTYDHRSQLTGAAINKAGTGSIFDYTYTYHADGNLDEKEDNLTEATTDCTYDGDLMTYYGANSLTWDKNGRLTDGLANLDVTWNWDHRLRSATVGSDGISCTYSPDGAMVSRATTISSTPVSSYKYIVDRVGKIPVVLLVLDADDDDAVVKSYVHALGQTLAQRDGGYNADKYFYLHDRLGSVRQVVHYNSGTSSVPVDHLYTYNPFGEHLETDSAVNAPDNMYFFAGYVWDSTISQYYCNARWYDPELARFTGRDPVFGDFKEPLTLHAYLYCLNDPVNMVDPTGENPIIGPIKQIVNAINMRNIFVGAAIISGNIDAAIMFHNIFALNIQAFAKLNIKHAIRAYHVVTLTMLECQLYMAGGINTRAARAAWMVGAGVWAVISDLTMEWMVDIGRLKW